MSPKASVSPVVMMMMTAMILETGPSIDCRTADGCSHGMLEHPRRGRRAERIAIVTNAAMRWLIKMTGCLCRLQLCGGLNG